MARYLCYHRMRDESLGQGVVVAGSELVVRNVRIAGRRTSVRLEQEMWDALHEISARERTSIHDLCAQVFAAPRPGGFTSALRVYIMAYFRFASRYASSTARRTGSTANAAAVERATAPATSAGEASNLSASR